MTKQLLQSSGRRSSWTVVIVMIVIATVVLLTCPMPRSSYQLTGSDLINRTRTTTVSLTTTTFNSSLTQHTPKTQSRTLHRGGRSNTTTTTSAVSSSSLFSRRIPTLADSAAEFRALATTCTDKATEHRYQDLYGRALMRFRDHQHHATTTTTSEKSSSVPSSTTVINKVMFLEIGLGCNYHGCAAGGMKLFTRFLPTSTIAYHSFEYVNPFMCKDKLLRHSNLTKSELIYIHQHLCPGSSADREAIEGCSKRFGLFDVIVDDGSHYHKHTTAGFRHWMGTSTLNPHAGGGGLKPGGTYIVEDLQVAVWPDFFHTAVDAKTYRTGGGGGGGGGRSGSEGIAWFDHPANRGVTFMNYAQGILLCKFAGVLCGPPLAGLDHAMEPYAAMIDEIIIARESVALRRAAADTATTISTEPQASPLLPITQDICMAFSSLDPARYRATNKRNTVTVLTIRCEGTEGTIGPSQERLNFFARHRLKPLQASDDMNDHHDDTQYLQLDLVLDDECSRNWTTCVAKRGAPLIQPDVATSQQQPSYPPPQGIIVVDLLWVHLPPLSSSTSATSTSAAATGAAGATVDRSKDDDELRLIEFIGFAMDPSSGMLRRGGSVIALSGSNRERAHERQQHERAQQTTYRMARDVTEPMLRFILDVTMLLMTAGGPSRRKNAKYPWRPSANTSSIVFRALKSVGEVSLDANGGAMLLRMME